MAFVASFRKDHIMVQKAKRGPRKSLAVTQRLDALHRRMGAAVSADLTRGLSKFKSRVNPEAVHRAWLTGDWGKVMESVPWEHMASDIAPAMSKGAAAIEAAGKETILHMPEPLQPHLRWDTKNPRVRDWIASRTAKNFTALSDDSAKNIQRAIRASMDQALTPRQVASRIKGSIGLLPRHAEAVDRYRQGLVSSGMSQGRAESMSDKYADRLLDWRANTIARTETRLATNQGQMSVWRQAADQGLVDRNTTGKRWVVDGDPCEVCEPMDGVTVPLDSFFTLQDGTTVDFPPQDVHPNCFCGLEIVYDLDAGDFDQS